MTMHEKIKNQTYDLYGGRVCFNEWCGVLHEKSTPLDTRIALPWSPRIASAQGVIGPGILAVIADIVGGQVASSEYGWKAQIATISLALSVTSAVPPRVGLLASGRKVVEDDGTILSDIRITTDDENKTLVATAQLRKIVIARPPSPIEPGQYPPIEYDDAMPFMSEQDIGFKGNGDKLHSRIEARPHFMGNVARRALHGGLVAAGLLETIAELGRRHERGFVPFDSVVDFLSPARDTAMDVSAKMLQAGGRIGFAEAEMFQEPPGSERHKIARLSATLRHIKTSGQT